MNWERIWKFTLDMNGSHIFVANARGYGTKPQIIAKKITMQKKWETKKETKQVSKEEEENKEGFQVVTRGSRPKIRERVQGTTTNNPFHVLNNREEGECSKDVENMDNTMGEGAPPHSNG
ncbi:unnamed protein product [Vicia faba]|uniref:Uncharacterized protein n=1 Tax=Vicia faba TaxID=3906 RepID=A0AAV1ASQ2_VICFA|nr:unnamed protein product [Vicia faba]